MGPESGGRGQCCQQLSEKLEKSEAGRKKLRQAISLLKEKMEATEKVLQINETLRQDLEKERKRAEAQSNEAIEQRRLREEMQQDGCRCKDEMVRILQRLDAVENCQKADRTAVDHLLAEVRQSMKGLGSSLRAIESAQEAFQALEKSLLTKVNCANQASEKALNLAKNSQENALSTLTACGAAETIAKTAQSTATLVHAEVEKLTTRVTLLQKQSTSLEQQITALLQQKETDCASEKVDARPVDAGIDRMASGLAKSKSKSKFGRGMVLSKNQLQNVQLVQSQRVTEGGSAVVINAVAPALTGTVQSTGSSAQPPGIVPSNMGRPTSATEAERLSVRVESLQKQHCMLEQRISTLFPGGKAYDNGKCSASVDVVGDRMSSGFIRPRNRSKVTRPLVPNEVQVQSTQPILARKVCKLDNGPLKSESAGKGGSLAHTDRYVQDVKEGSIEQLSRLCPLTKVSAEPAAPVETVSARKRKSSGPVPLDLVESLTHLLHKGSRNQSKMQAKLQALQEALLCRGQENTGNISATEKMQGNVRCRVKRKRNGRQGCNDQKDDLDQVETKKWSKERKKRREEDSRYEKHHIDKMVLPPSAGFNGQLAERPDSNERSALTSVEAASIAEGLKLDTTLGLNRSTCSQIKCDHPMETEDAMQLHNEEGAEDLSFRTGETAVVVSEWELGSGCDDTLWADWLAGKLELLSPYVPSNSLLPLHDGARTEERCSVGVGATGVGDETNTTVNVHYLSPRGENCSAVLNFPDDGSKQSAPETTAAPENDMIVDQAEVSHVDVPATAQATSNGNPPAGEDAGKDAGEQPGAETIPNLSSNENLVLDVIRQLPMDVRGGSAACPSPQGENCSAILNFSDDGSKQSAPETPAAPENDMIVDQAEVSHADVPATAQATSNGNPPAGEATGEQPGAEAIPNLSSNENLVLDVIRQLPMDV